MGTRAVFGRVPNPWGAGHAAKAGLQRVSAPWVAWLTGICGGTLGGMFSASGPVLGLFGLVSRCLWL